MREPAADTWQSHRYSTTTGKGCAIASAKLLVVIGYIVNNLTAGGRVAAIAAAMVEGCESRDMNWGTARRLRDVERLSSLM